MRRKMENDVELRNLKYKRGIGGDDEDEQSENELKSTCEKFTKCEKQ